MTLYIRKLLAKHGFLVCSECKGLGLVLEEKCPQCHGQGVRFFDMFSSSDSQELRELNLGIKS